MSRRALALPLALLAGLALSLTACGDDSPSSASSSPLSQVAISGDFGKAPQVSWKGTFEASGTTTKVITEGDGPEVAEGDSVDAQIWIGNGYSKQEVYSTYDQGQPQNLTIDSKSLSKPFLSGIMGQKAGSRVAVATTASAAFGADGNPQLGIGNRDSILLVIDVIGEHVPPRPQDVAPSKLPRLELKKGDPAGFDFSKVDKPSADGPLLRSVIKQGSGATLSGDETVTADYLGMVYGGKSPFDESYTKKPVPFSLNGVVEGWKAGLTGVKVGSRVLLQIPPRYGYGNQAQSGIPADSTLYFVIDVKKAQ